jgi:glycine cleavage system regulatory protein
MLIDSMSSIKSSKNPNDLASLLEDDGQSGNWIESRFSNHELDTAIFLDISAYRNNGSTD